VPTQPEVTTRPGPVVASPVESTKPRFIRVLLSGGMTEVVLEGETIRAWGVDGKLIAEAAGRVTLAAVGERIRWNGSRLLGDTLDAAGTPDLRVGNRGGIGRVRLLARKGELRVVAVVPLEAYVAAVLSRESPPRFHPEALAALAVAVRTYAVGAAANPRDPAYDVVGTVEDQVFEGMDGVSAVFREASDRTLGLVVRYKGELARTVYHSTCGGRTEDAVSAWGKDIPYLRAQFCTDCADSPAYRWEYRMSGAEGRRVAKALGVPPGKDLRIAVAGRTPTGRASRVLISSGGVSRELQAAEFRKAAGYANVRSLKMEIVPVAGEWRFTGEGWGHGVGMCQFGANGMARRGAGFREILARYYPGTEILGETP
jgi:stage II sporulation protein D